MYHFRIYWNKDFKTDQIKRMELPIVRCMKTFG